jgi:hypothetical protein
MAWIEYHTALRDHWKIKRLAIILGIEYPHALGIVSCLWLWVAEYSPKGDIERFSDEEIRDAARCNMQKFSKDTLKKCELINDRGKINDWNKHGLKLLVSNRKRVKEYRERLRNSNVTDMPTNLTNHTLPDQPKQTNINIPPTIEEVINYCKERNKSVDPNKFYNHYQAKGWLIGRSKIKDWKAAVRTWEQTKNFTPVTIKKKPARLQVLEMIALKIDKDTIKNTLLADGYAEAELDEALGKT